MVLPALAIVGAVSGDSGAVTSSAVLSLAATTGGELIERYLFFRRSRDRRCRGGCPHEEIAPASRIFRRFRSLVRAKDGRLTRELLRAPGRFGLGQVPAAKTPDATTGMVCGFCSTGCGLTVHLRDGQADQPEPDDRLPGEPGHGLPQGVGGPDRARRSRPRDRPAAAG